MVAFLIISGFLALFFIALFLLSRPSGAMSVGEEIAVHSTKVQEYGKVLSGGCACGSKKQAE